MVTTTTTDIITAFSSAWICDKNPQVRKSKIHWGRTDDVFFTHIDDPWNVQKEHRPMKYVFWYQITVPACFHCCHRNSSSSSGNTVHLVEEEGDDEETTTPTKPGRCLTCGGSGVCCHVGTTWQYLLLPSKPVRFISISISINDTPHRHTLDSPPVSVFGDKHSLLSQ